MFAKIKNFVKNKKEMLAGFITLAFSVLLGATPTFAEFNATKLDVATGALIAILPIIIIVSIIMIVRNQMRNI